jgi:uncharacterized protein YndB with AHSA1/START domain
MNARTSDYGSLIEPATLRIQRVLTGPIDRVWAYLTDGELRRQWLAAGPMEMKVGTTFELVWRNDELTNPPGTKPAGFGSEHRMESRITEFDPPRRLAYTWGEGTVTFELEPQGPRVLLTLTHTRLPDREMTLKVGAGWHAHLDILAHRLAGAEPAPFWDSWVALKQEYDRRVPR